MAWNYVAALWYRQHGAQVPADRCAGCGRPISSGDVLLLPHGERAHADREYGCIIAYGRRWKAAAAKALAVVAIPTPPFEGARRRVTRTSVSRPPRPAHLSGRHCTVSGAGASCRAETERGTARCARPRSIRRGPKICSIVPPTRVARSREDFRGPASERRSRRASPIARSSPRQDGSIASLATAPSCADRSPLVITASPLASAARSLLNNRLVSCQASTEVT